MLAARLDDAAAVTEAALARLLVSEKFDGVRAAWDGRKYLWTRGGQKVRPPRFLAEALPRGVALDGELFAGRGKFKTAQSLYASPSNAGWRGVVQYRAFDMPHKTGPFSNVHRSLAGLLPSCGSTRPPFTQPACAVRQSRVRTPTNLRAMLETVLTKGGEGLMLRRSNRPYRHGARSSNIMKLKKKSNAEAVVVGYKAGKGANAGLVGSLQARWVKNPGVTFFVGSGLTDAHRRNARRLFPVGAQITVEYMELTEKGAPRHPVLKGARTNL